MKLDDFSESVALGLRVAYGVSAGIAILGVLFGASGAFMYYVGLPEHVSHSEMGTRYSPEYPPGLPFSRTVMLWGFGLLGLGVAGLIVAGAVHFLVNRWVGTTSTWNRNGKKRRAIRVPDVRK